MSISHITFIDIETVPLDNPERMNTIVPVLFEKRFERDFIDNVTMPYCDFYSQKASLHAEFGKIVAISIGKLSGDKFYIKSLASRNETDILNQASEAINKIAANDKKAVTLCAHNGFEFDFPFWMRRCIINRLPLPEPLNLHGKKPWEIMHHDTMKIWSGTAWNYKVSLDLLASIFGLPSPKVDMQGKDIAKIYYSSFTPEEGELPFDAEEKALKKIGSYCAGDVLTLANVFSIMKGLPVLDSSKVEYL
jgi:uncharacterized protein YprB with RNaseH-like and TPR domain